MLGSTAVASGCAFLTSSCAITSLTTTTLRHFIRNPAASMEVTLRRSPSAAAAERMQRLTLGNSENGADHRDSAAPSSSFPSLGMPIPPLPPPGMEKLATARLLLLRHGQAMHNPRAEAARESGCTFEEFLDWMEKDDAYDAELTPLGETQARNAGLSSTESKRVGGESGSGGENASDDCARVRALRSVDVIFGSPLSRALQTADLVHPPTTAESPPRRVCIEHFREINGKLLNAKRRPRDELEVKFPHWSFENLPYGKDENWNPREYESRESCGERGYKGMLHVLCDTQRVTRRDERTQQSGGPSALIVCHGGLLNLLLNEHPSVVLLDSRGNGRNSTGTNSVASKVGSNGGEEVRCVTKRFGNCEMREFVVSAWCATGSSDTCGENNENSIAESKTKNETFGIDDVTSMVSRFERLRPIITLEEVILGEDSIQREGVYEDELEDTSNVLDQSL